MDHKAKAQKKYFEYLKSTGKFGKKTDEEFEHHMAHGGMVDHMEHGEKRAPHTKQPMPKFAYGGMVDDYNEPMDNFDYIKGHETSYDSSGEPHTEFELEDEHPMEYMNKGGKVGSKSRSEFVKALKRGR